MEFPPDVTTEEPVDPYAMETSPGKPIKQVRQENKQNKQKACLVLHTLQPKFSTDCHETRDEKPFILAMRINS